METMPKVYVITWGWNCHFCKVLKKHFAGLFELGLFEEINLMDADARTKEVKDALDDLGHDGLFPCLLNPDLTVLYRKGEVLGYLTSLAEEVSNG